MNFAYLMPCFMIFVSIDRRGNRNGSIWLSVICEKKGKSFNALGLLIRDLRRDEEAIIGLENYEEWDS